MEQEIFFIKKADRLNPSEETKSQFDQIEQTIIGFQNQITEKRTK